MFSFAWSTSCAAPTSEVNGAPREVTDADAIKWSCIEATAAGEGKAAVAVVCTPSGGAQSVRLELSADWIRLPETELLAAIAGARVSPSGPEER